MKKSVNESVFLRQEGNELFKKADPTLSFTILKERIYQAINK